MLVLSIGSKGSDRRVRRVLTQSIVAYSLRCVPRLGLIYLSSPKVASRTIHHSLVSAANARTGTKRKNKEAAERSEKLVIDNIFEHPLFGSSELRKMTTFALVRNPFTRILSGYLNKIVDRRPASVWWQFAREHGFDADARENEMSFIDFLRIIDTDCDETINAHFRPQYLNLVLPFSRPSFIGRLEEFDKVEKFLAERGVAKMEQKGAATNTSGRLQELYTPEAEAIVARKFADDFRLFGYSPKLSEVGILLEPQWQENGPDLLMQWLADRNFPVDQLDPAPRAYVQFCAEKVPEKRLEIIRGIFSQDDNTKRLRTYARKARLHGDRGLSRAVDERYQMLKTAWRERVEGYTIPFSPKNKRSAQRAGRHEKRGIKHKVDATVPG